jgi:hypothetical protein
MEKHIVPWARIWLLAVFTISTMLGASAVRANEVSQILRGFEIAPVKLNLRGKDWALVGLGSYLVNTTGCNDCHTHPNWADGKNPYILNQQPGQINTKYYMSGGRIFGPVTNPIATSANITPDSNGRPAGLTLAGFLEVMHTGHDPRDPPDDVLQIMPWPLYRWKTDRDLTAMYEYLRAIPPLQNNPYPGP